MNIVVLAGGISPERDVSLSSGSLIANSLIRSGHRVFLLDIYRGCRDYTEDSFDSLFIDKPEYSYTVPDTEPDLDAVISSMGGQKSLIGENVIDICRRADVVFMALHGGIGENGHLQATLDSFGITNYTGSGATGAVLAMDKGLTKRLIAARGINTAPWITVKATEASPDDIINRIGLPCVVKPCGCGSSCGVSIVSTKDELSSALLLAKKYEDNIVIEKKICGREFSVGILGSTALPPIEIILDDGWYDYKNKYQGKTREITPADLTQEQTDAVSAAALAVHETLGLGSYSRIDFLLDSATGEFVCLEANTLPGMTPTSLLPQEAAAVGISYDELCESIALQAMN